MCTFTIVKYQLLRALTSKTEQILRGAKRILVQYRTQTIDVIFFYI